ncbi:hypothetical protein HOG11_02560, partial [bacterium]|nr:hypothetical protein [bacterium]
MKILGKVINGDGEGKGLGFPTANLKLENSLNLEDGPTLETKEFKIEITDVEARATNVPVVGVEGEGVGPYEYV